ncbi:PGF-CTERM-anchored ABC transporter substrate-binding protein [Halorubrum sp. DTA98]|uniref:PGF-CTERM-anchored ABC transporter substrate-binding protein n=1 Tax=Halorubrum sp. DTA98 TaxID=3402163 RepID=UPI003AAEF4BC
MRALSAVTVAVLVATAFVGGFAGVAAGSGASHTIDDGASAPADVERSADVADRCEFPLTVTDATGEEITIEEPPERITTTNPSAAQTLWAIGAEDRVVGVTQFAAYLDGADEKANVSAEFGIDTERVVGTEADLVLAPNASADDVGPLRDAGETVYHFPEATDVDDIAAKTERIGLLVGECEAAAETTAWMYEEVDAVEERTADLDRPAALYPLGSGFVAAGDTFIDEIMTIGGVDNVAAADHEGYPQLSDEVIVERDPELILVTDPDAMILDEEPYSQTTAGLEGNAVVMQVHYLNQPAPLSVVESTSTLADAVEEYDAGKDDERADETPTADDDDGVDAEAPGFGVAVAVVAALLATLAAVSTARRP